MKKFREQTLLLQKVCTTEEFLGKTMPTIGIHGIAGSFTDLALYRFTHEILGITEKQYGVKELVEADTVVRAVANREVDLGIFAFANSGSGGYVSSVETMGKYSYKLVAQFTMPINMCLLGHPSIHSIKNLREFRGHPVAISQCRHTLKNKWLTIPVHPDTDAMDTALSAKLLAAGGIPRTCGIFASETAAKLYSLNILAKDVHHDPNNATFFAIIKHV